MHAQRSVSGLAIAVQAHVGPGPSPVKATNQREQPFHLDKYRPSVAQTFGIPELWLGQ